MTRTRGPSVRRELLHKSREAALNAVQTFNNPLTAFKADTFIVLMSIAWTYLLHAYYRREGVEYRYYQERPKRRRFDRTRSDARNLGKGYGVLVASTWYWYDRWVDKVREHCSASRDSHMGRSDKGAVA